FSPDFFLCMNRIVASLWVACQPACWIVPSGVRPALRVRCCGHRSSPERCAVNLRVAGQVPRRSHGGHRSGWRCWNKIVRCDVASPRGCKCRNQHEEAAVLGWAVTFLIIALIAALLGFGMIAGVAIEAAKIVFFVAVVLFAISVIAGLMRGGRPTIP